MKGWSAKELSSLFYSCLNDDLDLIEAQKYRDDLANKLAKVFLKLIQTSFLNEN